MWTLRQCSLGMLIVVGSAMVGFPQGLGAVVLDESAERVLGAACYEYRQGSVEICSSVCGQSTRQETCSGSAKPDAAVPCGSSQTCTALKTLSGNCSTKRAP